MKPIIIAALMLVATSVYAQKLPVYTCQVYDTGTFDNSQKVVFGIIIDNTFQSKIGVPAPASGEAGMRSQP